MANARQIVTGPSFTSLPYGLWEAAQKPSAQDAHWQNGITYEELCSGGGTTYDECIAVTGTGGELPGAPASKAANVDNNFRGATPFTVYTQFDCSMVGNVMQDQAEAALAKVEGWQTERAFWTGTGGGASTVWPHLAEDTTLTDPSGILLQSAATPLVTGGGDAAHVLGAVEQSLADCYHGQGLIHMAPSALPTFSAWDLVTERDGALWTRAGNRVVVGAGYTGSSPAGSAAAAGTSWIYATGQVFAYRSQVFSPRPVEAFDRAENTQKMLAERTYLFGWECCHIAALVTLGVPT